MIPHGVDVFFGVDAIDLPLVSLMSTYLPIARRAASESSSRYITRL
jgi:hypothetical protein